MILHATSKEEKDISTLQIPKIRAEIIHNGVDIPIHWTSNKAYLSNKLRLLYLGRLDPKKGLENLIDAMALLDNPQITLSIYGSGNSGYTSKLQNKVKQAGLCDGRVKFNGHVEGEAKDAAFRNADILILPSHSENFGMAIAEALAHGVPVIASRNTPWNGLEMKKCGLWVDNSPKSLVDAINSIRKMDLAEMSQNGRQWMKDEFSWDVIGNKIFNLYNEVTR
jgi:glycosyltransferase involved in cell wall biosynthesis